MAFVTARGARFHTVELGSSGPRVVMLHGLFTASLASWYLTVAPALAARTRIRLIDWRGHGLSERTQSGYGSNQMARDLAALTEDLDRFAIVGHSFGAIVAVRFALAQPDRVTRMALVDPPLADGARPWWTRDESRLTREQARAASPRPGGQNRAGLALCRLIEETSILSELEAEPPLSGVGLRELAQIPTLMVVGAESPYRAAAEGIAQGSPGMFLRVLPGGHDLQVAAKRPLADLLVSFLEVPDG
ncbi:MULTISPECIES: alpha/beta hydrolase [unclassified Nocardia]|uniref:alpha/beta fold hydrolase n=1 Tax=unclassified Nocardia TaxID=2637762 RepID=UPI0034403B16